MEGKKQVIPAIMTIILVAMMILMAELFQEKEFIFPEITALTIGAWLAPKQVWKTSKFKLVLLIFIYASLGIILVKYLNIALYFKILIGFICCMIGLAVSKTTFAPLISATILPIIINSESWLYPFFAATMSILVVLGQQYLQQRNYRPRIDYQPVNVALKKTIILNIKRLLVLASVALVAIRLDLIFLVAPPLLVAFVELSSNHQKLRKNVFVLATITFLCAFSGAYVRILVSEIGQMPLTLSAILIVIIMLAVLQHFGLYFPPAGALAILPLLIAPAKLMIYPFVVLSGFSIFAIFAFIITKTE